VSFSPAVNSPLKIHWATARSTRPARESEFCDSTFLETVAVIFYGQEITVNMIVNNIVGNFNGWNVRGLIPVRGGACVYQGEELGLTEAEIDFSDLQDPFGIVDQQEKDPDSVLHMFRRFVAWRKGQPALIRGAIRLLPSDGTILAFATEV
jgi:hypothetical protein